MAKIKIFILPFFYCFLFLVSVENSRGQSRVPNKKDVKIVIIDAEKKYQQIDGFGVNITPAQWNNGKLKPAIDLLVNDLGATLFRFDCVGLANWLDPSKRKADGKYPEEYLNQVYTNKTFTDAWQTFRYLNAKNIIPQFNVSGRIPISLGRSDNPRRLADFDAYAEMIVTMLQWAREKEHLRFSLLSPFNETDLGFPEGPKIEIEDVIPALKSMIHKLDEHGLSDIKLIILDDANVHLEKLQPVLNDSSLKNRIAAFGTHTYGNGDAGEGEGWFANPSKFEVMVQTIKNSAYKNIPCWMTEYGDLDQSNEIEFEFALRSTRRLLKFLKDGFSAAQAWDAFDNFHEHDTAWALYGLLRTNKTHWTYTPKHRYYAAKQVYKFVPPGFSLIAAEEPRETAFNIYKDWQHPLKNIQLLAFTSDDKKEVTLTGINAVEGGALLNIDVSSLHLSAGKKIYLYETSRTAYCRKVGEFVVKNNRLTVPLSERSIFTITTLGK